MDFPTGGSMRLVGFSTISVLILGMWGSLMVGAGAATDGQAAFQKMKSLAGDWEAKMPDGSITRLHYELIAAGSAVTEHYVNDRMGPENAMVSVYYLNGGQLALQHYCMERNRPRFEGEFDPGHGTLRFGHVTGLSSRDEGHMHDASFRFIDADHFNYEWHLFENGKATFGETMQFSRVR